MPRSRLLPVPSPNVPLGAMSTEKLESPLRTSVSGNNEWGEDGPVENNITTRSHWQRLEQKLKEIGVESRGVSLCLVRTKSVQVA